MSTTKRGLFITVEGNEGSGKSTQIKILADRLRSAGYDLLLSAEPGGTRIGREIRRILLHKENPELSPTAELLLMFACRAQNVDEWILPALAAGKLVLSDRFTDSTLAYQGAGRGLGSEVVLDIDRIACRGLVPDLTLCFMVDIETGLARAHARNRRSQEVETRLDEEETAFYRKVRDAYYQLANDEPERVKIIECNRPMSEIADDAWREVENFLASRIARFA